MSSLHRLSGRRLLGALAAIAAVAVAIPAASGAGLFSHNGSKPLCSHICTASALVSQSTLKLAMGAPKGGPPGPGKGAYTCTDGSIPPGTYDSITVAGQCAVDEGIVKVRKDVTVQPNAGLFAAFGNGPELA